MILLLVVLSALAILAFVVTLGWYLKEIAVTLERIGGEANSYLAKTGFGVRAIEKQTSQLGPAVGSLNDGLMGLASSLEAIEDNLSAVADRLRSPRSQ